MGEAPWTEERVRAAYAEWQALNDHAVEVVEAMHKSGGDPNPDVWRLELPGWVGTGWPGREMEFRGYGGEDPRKYPLEWLWTYPACVEKRKAEHAAWQATHEAEEREREERREYERLKAKFESMSDD